MADEKFTCPDCGQEECTCPNDDPDGWERPEEAVPLTVKEQIAQLLGDIYCHGNNVVQRLRWALEALLQGDEEAALRNVAAAKAVLFFIEGPFNWVNHPEYINPDGEPDEEGNLHFTVDYHGGVYEYTVEIPR